MMSDVQLRAGGWFVTGESWSGPWATKEAAELAADGEYTLAHIEHRKAFAPSSILTSQDTDK